MVHFTALCFQLSLNQLKRFSDTYDMNSASSSEVSFLVRQFTHSPLTRNMSF